MEDEKVAPARRKTKASRDVTRSKLVFAVSELAILCVSAELQLRAKELKGPETVHNPQEANKSEPIHTVHVYFSGEFNCVEFEYTVHVDKLELACTTHVKGRLKKRIVFWQSIGASRWVLEVLEDGYCLPFISLPQKAIFRNHYSVVEDEDFVCQEVSKLLSSGAIAEVERDDLMVCNPLGVVRNSAHKPRLIVDLHYINTCGHVSSSMRTFELRQICFQRVTGSSNLIITVATTT